MKKSFLPFLLLAQCTIAQTDSTNVKHGEFTIYDNGMIYSETTMSQVGKLADSLNLRFKICEPKTFHSLEQGYGTYFSITKNVKKAREAILQNVTLDQFIKHFPRNEIKKNNLIVKEQWFYEGKRNVAYACLGDEYRSLYPDVELKNSKGGWVYQDYGDEIEAVYIDELKSYTIPNEYARLIQYVDCMIDTTAMIFPEITLADSSTYNLAPNSKVQEFINIAMDFDGKPVTLSMEDWRNEELALKYQKNYSEWNQRRMVALDKKMQDANTFKLFNEAVDEAIAKQNGFYLEVYTDRYLPAKRNLQLRRSYQVHGSCSADTRPREHAQRICELAAEAK